MRTTYKINITTRAQQDTENIFVYLERERRFAATKFFNTLKNMRAGYVGRLLGIQKFGSVSAIVVPTANIPFLRYRLAYRIQRRVVIILRVVHQSQLLREVE